MSENEEASEENRGSKAADDYSTAPLRRRNETALTHELKWAAWKWLFDVAECRAIGFEVRLEGPFGRIVDVVGVGRQNIVYIVEVKSSRSDLRRDDYTVHDRRRVAAERAALRDAADLTEKILDDARAHALDSAEGEAWDQAPTYRAALRDHEEVEKRLSANERRMAAFSTKFHDPAFLACADYHYIMAPSGLVSRSELPPFWGLIDESPATVVEAVPKQVRRNTVGVLRAIAKANTRDLMKASRLPFARQPPATSESEDD